METALHNPTVTMMACALFALHPSIVSSQSTCPNSDFSQGNFVNWQGTTGTYTNPSQALGLVNGRHTIMTTQANDPFTCGGLTVIPPGETSSARLGNSGTGAQAEKLIYSLNVSQQTALFIYKYAVVLENPSGHTPAEQPEFDVRLLDVNGISIGGSCGTYNVYGGQPGQNFQVCGGVTWLPWSTVGIDLTTYIGQTVQIEFTTKDCILTGHFGYAYISAACAPMTLDLAYCSGDTQITLTAPAGFQQYQWNPGAMNGQSITIPTPSLGTVYTCTMTSFSNQGNCQVTLPIQIVPTTVTAAFTALSGCEGTGIQFSDQSSVTSGTITFWDWNFGDGQTASLQHPLHSFSNGGSYLVQLIAQSSGGCVDTISQEIDIYNNPSVDFISEGVCANSLTNFTNQSADVFPLTYSWNFGDGSSPDATTHPSHTFTTPALYNVTLTATNAMGCSAGITHPTTLFAPPQVIAGSDITICSGTNVTLTATGAVFYQWNNGITNGVAFTPTLPGVYTVVGTDVNGCSAMDQAEVFFHPNPIVDAGPEQTICFGEAILLSGNGAQTYTWNNGVVNGISFLPPLGSTVYTVSGTDLNGCVNTDFVTIHTNPLPVVNAGSDQVICAGSSVTLLATGAQAYEWSNGVVNGVPFDPLVNQLYVVTGTDQNGCVNTDMVTVSIEAPVTANFSVSSAEGCAPLEVTFANLSSGGTNCYWEFSDGSSAFGCGTVTHTFTDDGCYDVTLTTTTALGCVSDTLLTDVVCVFPNPFASFDANPVFMTQSDPSTTMINASIGATAYEWAFGDGNSSLEQHPTHTYSEDVATYVITLTAISEHGCIDTSELTVQVQEELIIYVPNTFTPDGDGTNDIFRPEMTSGFDRETYHLYIFNRWGQLVFESKDIDYGWNGSFAGEVAQDGTYTWKIEFKSLDRNKPILEAMTGHVNILK